MLLIKCHPSDVTQTRHVIAGRTRVRQPDSEFVGGPPQDRLQQTAVRAKNGLHDEVVRLAQWTRRLDLEHAPSGTVFHLELHAPEDQFGMSTDKLEALP